MHDLPHPCLVSRRRARGRDFARPRLQRNQLLTGGLAGGVVLAEGDGHGRERKSGGDFIRIVGGAGQCLMTGGGGVQPHNAARDRAANSSLLGDIELVLSGGGQASPAAPDRY